MTTLLAAIAGVSLFVGGIGIVMGFVSAELVTRFAEWPAVVPANAIGVASGFAAATGICFGFYPARKAASPDPIEALRFTGIENSELLRPVDRYPRANVF